MNNPELQAAATEIPQGVIIPDILILAQEAERMKETFGNREVGALNLPTETRELTETHEEVFASIMERVKNTMNFLLLKPAAWLGNVIKDHPFKTALIALAGFALWYYALPLSAGLSVLAEEGVHLTSELLTKLIDIDPTTVDVFTDLFKEIPNGPPVG